MVTQAFKMARTPRLVFGPGVFQQLPSFIDDTVGSILIITGARSFRETRRWADFLDTMIIRGITVHDAIVSGEPSPDLVDGIVEKYRGADIDLVIGIGGGSVVDAGKAVSAMMHEGRTVVDFLESVGNGARHSGDKVPYIAVPTTAGTGSEATKNAVLSRVGTDGFKKSLRHDNFVPDVAVIDPELALSCPPAVTASCGMDAFTQLLESYVSSNANTMTDTLAWSGLERIADSLLEAYNNGITSIEARADMAYAAYISGITLANAGLGVVHGFASPVGGHCDIPHGTVCGSLMAPSIRVTVKKLREAGSEGEQYLEKFAEVGALLSGEDGSRDDLCDTLITTVEDMARAMNITAPSELGIPAGMYETIVDETGLKNNPISLDRTELMEILTS